MKPDLTPAPIVLTFEWKASGVQPCSTAEYATLCNFDQDRQSSINGLHVSILQSVRCWTVHSVLKSSTGVGLTAWGPSRGGFQP